jgi:hypothetical protein
MKNPLTLTAISALALAAALPAGAQQYRPTPQYERNLDQYEAAQDRYEARRDAYEDRRADYRADRRDYDAARREYDRRLADWDRARIDYDRRYGRGAYARHYPRPVWDERRWADYDVRYADHYGRNATAMEACNSNNSAVAGGVIGALAGAILGSQVAGHGARTEGSVIGGLAGAGLGAAVGHQHDKYKCDNSGPYFTYNETVPFRPGRYHLASGHDRRWYRQRGCRMAAAPVDAYGRDVRYVPVCPDSEGRFRITG